jgi:hypothetical protein
MNLVAWIMGLVAPIVIRGLVALGFTAVTFTGVSALAGQLITIAQNNWASLPTAVLQLAEVSGIPEALGMIAGAYVARVALWASINSVKYVLKT